MVELAVARRTQVSKESKEDLRNSNRRRGKHLRGGLNKRERNFYPYTYIITTSDELFKAVSDIDQLITSTSKKKQEKLLLLRNQITFGRKCSRGR